MARNEEKAQSMLNRWTAMRFGQLEDISFEKRPTVAANVNSIDECEKWRRQVNREIGDKVAIIQNPSLGESRIRDLNDEINKLLKQKWHWEKRIADLGGPDYRVCFFTFFAPMHFNFVQRVSKITDANGSEVLIIGNYRYFGAAKQLPSVQQLIKTQQKQQTDLKRVTMIESMDHTYFGLNEDEQDAQLMHLEKQMEEEMRKKEESRWNKIQEEKKQSIDEMKRKGMIIEMPDFGISEQERVAGLVITTPLTQEQIEQELLERKKKELLALLDHS